MNELPYLGNDHTIDSQALQQQTLVELNQLKEMFEALLTSRDGVAMIDHLTNATALIENEKQKATYQLVVRQIKGIGGFIESWVHMAVDSRERLEFFVKAKAEEVRSGDDQKDYFWALTIRYDQLIALLRVLRRLYAEVKRWLRLAAKEIMDDPIFSGLLEVSVEDQIYLEAQQVAKERQTANAH